MPKLTFEEERCKGCGLCINACPKKILALSDKINRRGYRPVECKEIANCIACAFCARMCPDAVITVEK